MILKECVRDAEMRDGRVADKLPKSPTQRKRFLWVAKVERRGKSLGCLQKGIVSDFQCFSLSRVGERLSAGEMERLRCLSRQGTSSPVYRWAGRSVPEACKCQALTG